MGRGLGRIEREVLRYLDEWANGAPCYSIASVVPSRRRHWRNHADADEACQVAHLAHHIYDYTDESPVHPYDSQIRSTQRAVKRLIESGLVIDYAPARGRAQAYRLTYYVEPATTPEPGNSTIRAQPSRAALPSAEQLAVERREI